MGRFYSKAVYQKSVYQKMYVIKNDCSLKIKNSIMLLLGLKCKLNLMSFTEMGKLIKLPFFI